MGLQILKLLFLQFHSISPKLDHVVMMLMTNPNGGTVAITFLSGLSNFKKIMAL